MTALPQPPGHLLTIAEYEQLPEDEQFRCELQEGVVVVSPSPTSRHMRASGRLFTSLEQQLPEDFCVIQDVDVNLELFAPNKPGQARRPDLVVMRESAYERTDAEGKMLRASEILIIVEIISPGSVRMDRVVKRQEYADAGIPHYWIVDVESPVSLINCHLAGEFGYQDGGDVTGRFATSVPFPVELDLEALIHPRRK